MWEGAPGFTGVLRAVRRCIAKNNRVAVVAQHAVLPGPQQARHRQAQKACLAQGVVRQMIRIANIRKRSACGHKGLKGWVECMRGGSVCLRRCQKSCDDQPHSGCFKDMGAPKSHMARLAQRGIICQSQWCRIADFSGSLQIP